MQQFKKVVTRVGGVSRVLSQMVRSMGSDNSPLQLLRLCCPAAGKPEETLWHSSNSRRTLKQSLRMDRLGEYGHLGS